jgi:hypothetical protein
LDLALPKMTALEDLGVCLSEEYLSSPIHESGTWWAWHLPAVRRVYIVAENSDDKFAFVPKIVAPHLETLVLRCGSSLWKGVQLPLELLTGCPRLKDLTLGRHMVVSVDHYTDFGMLRLKCLNIVMCNALASMSPWLDWTHLESLNLSTKYQSSLLGQFLALLPNCRNLELRDDGSSGWDPESHPLTLGAKKCRCDAPLKQTEEACCTHEHLESLITTTALDPSVLQRWALPRLRNCKLKWKWQEHKQLFEFLTRSPDLRSLTLVNTLCRGSSCSTTKLGATVDIAVATTLSRLDHLNFSHHGEEYDEGMKRLCAVMEACCVGPHCRVSHTLERD